jgi:hypothetical protein
MYEAGRAHYISLESGSSKENGILYRRAYALTFVR